MTALLRSRSIDKQELITPQQHLGVLLPQGIAHRGSRIPCRQELNRQSQLSLRGGMAVQQLVSAANAGLGTSGSLGLEPSRQGRRLLLQERGIEREQLLQ